MSLSEYLPLLKKTRLFSEMSGDEIVYIVQVLNGIIREYKSESYVYQYGDSLSNLKLLLDGDVLLIREDAWGNSNILTKINPGDEFGFGRTLKGSESAPYSALTPHGCKVLSLEKDRFIRPFEDRFDLQEQLIKNIINILVVRIMSLNVKIEFLAQRKTRDKIIAYLSYVSQIKNSVDFHIPYSRRELAEYLCVDRSALSNELCKLRDEGLIEFERNHFILKTEEL